MTPIDPGCLDLIHAEIDGLNSPSDSENLRQILARDPAARKQFHELEELASALTGMADIDPPADLHGEIMRTVEPAGVRRRITVPGRIEARWRKGPAILRYGYTFAAGLILGVAGLAWYLGGAGFRSYVQPSQVEGTMARSEAEEALVQRIPIDLNALSGNVSLWRSQEGGVITMDLDARSKSGPVAVSLSTVNGGISLTGLSQARGRIQEFRAGDREMSWELGGHHELAIRFAAPEDAGGQILLEVLVPGAPVRRFPMHLN